MNKIILMLSILIFGCSKEKEPDYTPPQFFLDLREIKADTIKELRKKGLYLNGIGEGGINCIEEVFYGFEYYKLVDIDQARELIVMATEIALAKINADERVRPHLSNYPFKAENLKITLDLKKNDKKVEKNKVRLVNVVTLSKGNISYKFSEGKKRSEVLKQETYKEAKDKVSQSAKSR